MKTIRLFIVRHGETEWNRQGIFRGLSDVPLSETGTSQAKKLGLVLATMPVSAIYSSRLVRAWKTAEAIAWNRKRRVTVRADRGLLDIHFGRLAGLTHKQAGTAFPTVHKRWFINPEAVSFPGGESLKNVGARARKTINRIAGGADGGNVIVVTHQVVIRAILCRLLGISLSHFRRFEIQPASISEARFEYGKWVLYRLNDVCHLETTTGRNHVKNKRSQS
jgi:probable phosphoglycerate mutase